jgi:hypothetical protein
MIFLIFSFGLYEEKLMMGKLIFLFTLFFLVSCSQKGEAPAAKIVIKNNFSIESASPGGMMLYLRHVQTGKARAIKIQEYIYDTVLENGNWIISVIAWQGLEPLTGNLICGTTSAIINGQETSINLSINSTQCNTNSFSPDEYRTAGVTNTIQFINCNTFDNVSASGANCDNSDIGISGSYKIHLLEYNNSVPTTLPAAFTALTSECIEANSGTNSITNTLIKLPLGFGIEKFTTVVESYTDSDCQTSKQSYFFQDGLVSGENSSSEMKSFAHSDKADIYLRRGGISITGATSIGPVNKNSASYPTFTIQNKSISPLTLTSVTLSGSATVAFQGGTFPGTDGNCAANSTLAPQASCDVVLAFNPTASGVYQPFITANYSDGASSYTSTFGFDAFTPAEMTLTTGSENLGTFAVDSSPSPISLTFTNIGGTNADLTSLSGITNYTLISNTCGSGSLAPNETCSLSISVPTSSVANFSNNLTLNYFDGSNSQTLSLPLTASVVNSANIQYFSGTTNFGFVGTNSSPIPQHQIVFKNNGDYTATLSGVFADSPFYVGTDTCTFGFLEPNEICYVDVYLSTASNFNNSPDKYVSVSYHDGTGNTVATKLLQGYVGSPPNLNVPNSLNLGYFTLNGMVTPSEITITNSGGSNATITSISGISTFSIVPGSDNCTNTTLYPGSTCTLSVTIASVSTGSFTETLQVNYTDIASSTLSASIILSASIVSPPNLVITKLTEPLITMNHDFGWSDQNMNSSPVQYQIFNNGGSVVTINENDYVGLGEGSPFSISYSTCGLPLLGGQTCDIEIVFNPTDSSPASTFFKVIYSGYETNPILLEGRGKPIVEPYYATAASWNDYFNHQSSSPLFSDSGDPCDFTATDCLHGGELKKIELTTFNNGNCNELTFHDNLNAFDWECVFDGTTVTFRSKGFAPNKGLKDLLNEDSFIPMKFIVNKNESLQFETTLTTWWSNPVIPLSGDIQSGDFSTSLDPPIGNEHYSGYNSSGTNDSGTLNTWVLQTEAAIYTVNSPIIVPSIYFGANKISLVTLGVSYISTTNDGTHQTCDMDSGDIAPGSGGLAALICVTNANSHGDFHWVEVNADGNNLTTPLLLVGTRYNRIHQSHLTNGENGLLVNLADTKNLFTNLKTRINNQHGVLLESSLNQVFHGLISSENGINGLYATVSSQNSFYQSKFMQNIGSGINLFDASNNIFNNLISSTNQNVGILVDSNSGDNIFSQVTTANNGAHGFEIIGSNANAIISSSSYQNTGSGLRFDNSSSNLVSNFVSYGNADGADEGVILTSYSMLNEFKHLVTTNHDTFNLYIDTGSTGNNFTLLFTGTTEGQDIYEGNGSSIVPTQSNFDLTNSFLGLVGLDHTNTTSLGSGTVPFNTINDFSNFDSFFRSWGKNDIGNTIGPCNPDETCSIWDWRLSQPDTFLMNGTQNSIPNHSMGTDFSPNTGCPDQVHGNEYSSLSSKDFLNLAIEEIDLLDGLGNDDGLCESNEKCIMTANFGHYQGEGSLQAPCEFENGQISNVTMRAFSQYYGN